MATQIQIQGLASTPIGKRRIFKSNKKSKMYAFDENFFHAFSKVLLVFIPVFLTVFGGNFLLNNSAIAQVRSLEAEVASLSSENLNLKKQRQSMLSYSENSKRAQEIGLVPVVKRQVKIYNKDAGRFNYKDLGS